MSARAPMRVLLECTDTHHVPDNTGIQRVARNLVRHARELGPELGLDCRAVVHAGAGFVEITGLEPRRSAELALARFGRDRWHELRRVAGGARRAARAFVPAGARAALKRARPLAPAPAASASDPLHPPAPQRGRAWELERYATALLGFPPRAALGRWIVPRAGDVVVTLDASWNWPHVQTALGRLPARGVRVGALVHDVLPARLPRTFHPELVHDFGRWLRWIEGVGDFCIANSEATRADLERHLAEGGIERARPLRSASFRLGAELDRREADGAARPELYALLERLAARPLFLTVGTLEPRKDHATILDAFERAWDAGLDASWLVAGKVGWLAEGLAARIARHPEHERRLFARHDLSDAELELAYRAARATVQASLGEGCGLPLVESLARGRCVIASDIAPHREVGGEACRWFAPGDAAALAVELAEMSRAGPAALDPRSFRAPPSWRESAREFLEVLARLASPLPSPAPSGRTSSA